MRDPHLVCKQLHLVVIQYSPAPADRANRFVWGPAMWYVSYKFHVQTYTIESDFGEQEVLRSAARRHACDSD